MTINISTWIPQIINWIIMAVLIFIAYRGFTHVIKTAVKESMEEAVRKLDEKMKSVNAIRNLRKIE